MKIVIGGQLDKKELQKMVEDYFGNRVDVEIKGDLEAALDVKNGKYDYYIGACNTGGGGALAMALAMLGKDLCATVSMPGNIMSDEKIAKEFEKGKKAFGFTASHREQIMPILLKNIERQGDLE